MSRHKDKKTKKTKTKRQKDKKIKDKRQRPKRKFNIATSGQFRTLAMFFFFLPLQVSNILDTLRYMHLYCIIYIVCDFNLYCMYILFCYRPVLVSTQPENFTSCIWKTYENNCIWEAYEKNDRRNSGGALRQKFNLFDIWHLIFEIWHLTFDIQPMDQWTNSQMDQRTKGPMD